MPLSLVTGRPNTGKTEILYALAAKSARSAVPTILLPSAPDVARARRGLCQEQGLVTIRVEQIDRYLTGLWEVYGDGRHIVTPIQRAALLQTAIGRSGLQEMTDSASTGGFAVVLRRLAGLMQRTPVPSEGGVAGGIARALAVYHELLLAHDIVELSEAIRVLAERVEMIQFDGPLLANRFDDLTAPQEQFLLAAARAGADVWLAMIGESGRPAMAATGDLLGRLRALAINEQVAAASHAGSPELLSLERGLFSPGALAEPAGGVALSVAYGEEAEAERTAAEVIAAQGAGVHPERIAIIYRDTRRHFPALRRALLEAGIPADYDIRLHFGETSFGRAVLSLLEFGASGRRTHLVAFLGSGFSGLDTHSVDLLDAKWRRQGITEGAQDLLSGLDRVDVSTRRFVRRAVGLAQSGADAGNAGDWKEMAGRLLAGAYGRAGGVLEQEALVDAAAHRRMCEAVDDLSTLGVLSCDALGLREVLAGSQVAMPVQERPGHVQVMDVERVRGRHFDCVILGGLVAGEFPRKTTEGILSPGRLRDQLEAQGVDLPRDKGSLEERLLFYLAVTRARKRLVLSRQAADSDGRPLRPSPLLEELLEMYGGASGSLETRTLAFADLGVHGAAPDLPRRALRTVAMSGSGDDMEMIARARSKLSGAPGTLRDERLLEHLAGMRVFSATELETYLGCPYSWFYGRFIRPEALEMGGEAAKRGTLAHKALFGFYAGLESERGISRVLPENLEACLLRAAQATDEVLAGELELDRLRERLLADEIRRLVEGLVRRDANFLPGYTPRYFEWPFGQNDDPPFEFDGFALKGRIDRIDFADNRFVVIDYKTGHASKVASFEAEGVLQAPLYAAIAKERFGGTCAGSFYRSLRGKRSSEQCRGVYIPELVSGPELTSTDGKIPIDDAIDGAIRRAAEAAAGIRAGRIERNPLRDASCRYCQSRTWCREAIV